MAKVLRIARDEEEVLVDVKVGDVVGFKCDIEQYGKIIKIDGERLTLEASDHFRGEYIHGEKTTTEWARDCWIEG